jgi:hypothetical protein
MRFSEGEQGRVFVLSLDDGETVPEAIERFAKEKEVLSGYCILIGGEKQGSRMVVGVKDDNLVPYSTLFHERRAYMRSSGSAPFSRMRSVHPSSICTSPQAEQEKPGPAVRDPE